MNQYDRRSFLKGCVCIAAAAGTAGAFSGCTIAGWFKSETKGDMWLSVGRLADLTDKRPARVETATGIADGKKIKDPKLVVLRMGENAYVMSGRCTHWGCEVNIQEDGSYLCPCHKSHFDRSGAVLKGPAKEPLAWFETRLAENGEVQTNIGRQISPPVSL
ncbi:exported hypothetical protein [uncultured Desulfobacterium sp.]|uniref:Rieske domain-containing protein n=1 Tax=uncultured Desulfobacterium sp. TaxID=201089 RepID=A0A445N1R9_9BACT|nr:exported hypothetical protein [uncultured Desulfobacterium sp.]